jgi:hypothetical protein
MAHPVPTNGIRITDANGSVLFFTGDTKPYPGMERGPLGADALLADACFVDASQTGPHLNVKEACAPRAGRGREDALPHAYVGKARHRGGRKKKRLTFHPHLW